MRMRTIDYYLPTNEEHMILDSAIRDIISLDNESISEDCLRYFISEFPNFKSSWERVLREIQNITPPPNYTSKAPFFSREEGLAYMKGCFNDARSSTSNKINIENPKDWETMILNGIKN